jgi:hypothetical protein
VASYISRSGILLRILKYRPAYPSKPFASIQEARHWVAHFVSWHNTKHHHSAIQLASRMP